MMGDNVTEHNRRVEVEMERPDRPSMETFLIGLKVARDAGRVSSQFYAEVEAIKDYALSLEDKLRESEQQREELREALQPFAVLAERFEPDSLGIQSVDVGLTDLHRAAALASKPDTEET